MKKVLIIITSFSLLFVFLLAGCKKTLNETNIRVPIADVYYKTAAGMKDLSNSTYSYARTFWGAPNGWQLNILGTDLWLNGGDGPKDLGYYTVVPSDVNLWAIWQNLYLGITACNTLIDRVDGVSELTKAQHDSYLGEALFLRALYYHMLVMNWGDVPLVIHEVTEVQTTATRTSADQVYAQIISDLLKAEQLLPVTQPEYGRATKPAVEALLARVYLWTKQYKNAETFAKKLINDYNFKLLLDYADIFKLGNDKNTEVIWSVQYTADQLLNEGGNQGQSLFLMRYDNNVPGMKRDIPNGRPFRHYLPSRYLLNLLASNLTNDSRFAKAYTSVWYANNSTTLKPQMKLGDTALFVPPYAVSQSIKTATAQKYTTIDVNDYYDANSPNGEVPKGARERFPSLNKFSDSLRPDVTSNASRKDFIVFRLAEMYLIAAEALMMQGNNTEGVTYINAIRQRAAWPGKENQMKLTAGQLSIDAILDERALELAGECVGRWADLKRTGKLKERIQLYNPDARPNFQDKYLLRPIPQNMIDRVTNKDEFKQNPGY